MIRITGFSFSYSSVSVLLRQPLSIKKSCAGAIQGETTRNPQKTFFKFLAGVSKTIAAVAVATAFRVLY
jgi:hypothetical protein